MTTANENSPGKPEGVITSPPATGSVFEAVDASSDEQYYTCGIWPTLEAAISAFKKLGDNYPGEDIADGVKIIEIRERKIGELDWAETGKVVAKFVWRKEYREADDSYEWRLTETPNSKLTRAHDDSAERKS